MKISFIRKAPLLSFDNIFEMVPLYRLFGATHDIIRRGLLVLLPQRSPRFFL